MSELYLHKRSSHVFPLTRIGEMPAITCGPVVFDAFLGLWSREKRLPHAAAMQRTNEIVALKEISTHTPMGVWKNEMSLPHLTGVMYAVGKENVWKIRNQLHDTRGNTAGDRQDRKSTRLNSSHSSVSRMPSSA